MACAFPAPSGTGPSPSIAIGPGATAIVSPSIPISATLAAALEIASLPNVALDASSLTAICDWTPSQTNLDAGESTIFCGDGLMLGLRAIRTATTATVTRLYLTRPACPAIPCTPDQLNTATVTGWTAEGAFSTSLDSRLKSVTAPTRQPAVYWPAAAASVDPQAAKPGLARAPGELRDRVAYPFCGRAEVDQPAAVIGCFRDAVLDGRKAEVFQLVYGTEGGDIVWLFRYDGHGALVRYSEESTRWRRQVGSLILGPTPTTWSFDPCSGGDLLPAA